MLLLDLFLNRPAAYRHATDSPRAPLWMSGFLLGTGALYGVLVAWFQGASGGALQGIPVGEIPAPVLYGGNVVAGILAALMLHGGVTLVLWLMVRAVGGAGRLGVLYRVGAYLLPLGFLALPFLASGSAADGAGGAFALPLAGLYLPLAWVAAAWLLAGLFRAVQATQGTSPARSLSVVGLFALFCGSILLVL